MVQLRNDGKVKWKQLEYMGEIGSGEDGDISSNELNNPMLTSKAQYNAVVAAFALSCSTAVMTSVNYDDLLATAHKHAKNSEL
jgi:mediator of RNA polymerase II transcription subunit 16